MNSCPDHSWGRRTAKLQVLISSLLRCSNKDKTRKKSHAKPCTCSPGSSPWPSGLNNSSKTIRAQSWADGGFDRASSAIWDPLPCLNNKGGWLAELTLQETRKKSRMTSSIWHLLPILPYNSSHHENIQLPKQVCSFTQFPSYYTDISGAFYQFTHQKHLQKPSENTAWVPRSVVHDVQKPTCFIFL